MERHGVRQVLQPIQRGARIPKRRRYRQLHTDVAKNECFRLWSGRNLLHPEKPAGQTVIRESLPPALDRRTFRRRRPGSRTGEPASRKKATMSTSTSDTPRDSVSTDCTWKEASSTATRRITSVADWTTWAVWTSDSTENHGRAKTKGYNVSLRYSYANWFSLGGTFNSMDAIDREKRLAEGTGQASLTYGQRIPNQPTATPTSTHHSIGMTCSAKATCSRSLTTATTSMSFPCTGEDFGDRIPKHASPNSSPTTSR